ncbi:phosphatase PAP2 family protein [Gemmiger formicilis]|uniref:phosphatase PAP2 family protein n=1 Tax=Gemmiger formicilis TaxID=745368 RepID=UPI001956920A|nr:phosphatase PAP2 family protein [Gemmiger formicilis]MBM6716851.1 phosphatase PAP2 family protein [Gemmiger formicilis]
MTADRYRAVIGWFNARPAAKKLLRAVSLGSVAAVYLLYAGLAVLMMLRGNSLLWPLLAVPAVVFVLGTALRRAINRPRPYETLGFAPLFPKDTKGQSLPSRHCFSAACIAVAAIPVSPAAAAVLAGLAVVIALTRVLCGVHYISDVLVGLVFGAAASRLGLILYFTLF